jgi:hypothetical protein
MSKNKKVMSIAIEPDLETELVNYSRKKGMSKSAYLGNLISKALKVPIDEDPIVIGKPVDEDVLPVMLKIPANLKGQREALKNWMDTQVNGIVNKLG